MSKILRWATLLGVAVAGLGGPPLLKVSEAFWGSGWSWLLPGILLMAILSGLAWIKESETLGESAGKRRRMAMPVLLLIGTTVGCVPAIGILMVLVLRGVEILGPPDVSALAVVSLGPALAFLSGLLIVCIVQVRALSGKKEEQ